MRSSSFIFSATTILILTAATACGDDSESTGSGGSTAQSTSSGSSDDTTSGGTGGDTGGPGPGSGGGDPTSSGGADGSGGAGGADTGTGGSGEGGQGDGLHVGRVLFTTADSGGQGSAYGSFDARFAETTDPGIPAECEETVVGECTLIVCTPAEEAPTQELRGAGDLTVTGTAIDVEVTETDGAYSFYEDGEVLFDPGDELSVSATGDEVPAFDGSVVAPGHATIDQPSEDDLVFSRDEDFVVTWDMTGDDGVLAAYLSAGNAAIYCEWPMGAGDATIPAELMGELPEANDASLSFYDHAGSTVIAGDWRIEIAAETTPETDSETAGFFGGIVLE